MAKDTPVTEKATPAGAASVEQPKAEQPKASATVAPAIVPQVSVPVAATNGPGRYRVTVGNPHLDGKTAEIQARDANEAWAVFCDGQKSWPSRKVAKPVIEFLGE